MRQEQYRVNAALRLQHWWNYGTKMFFLRLIERTLPPGALLLDAGCGVGDLLGLLQARYQVVGFDRSADAIAYSKQAIPAANIVQGDLAAFPFAPACFDGIVSLDVLYHAWVQSDLAALQEMTRLLKPGGKLFLQLPAYEWLRSGHDAWSYTARRYTAGGLKNLLRAAGLTPQKVGYRVCWLLPLAVLQRRILKAKTSDLKPMPPLLNACFKAIMTLENFLAFYVNFPFGLSVIGVAEKELGITN